MNWLIVLYAIGSLLISIGAGITLREKDRRTYYDEHSFTFIGNNLFAFVNKNGDILRLVTTQSSDGTLVNTWKAYKADNPSEEGVPSLAHGHKKPSCQHRSLNKNRNRCNDADRTVCEYKFQPLKWQKLHFFLRISELDARCVCWSCSKQKCSRLCKRMPTHDCRRILMTTNMTGRSD